MSEPADVAIVGAGAAGLATAIFAGRRVPALRTVLLDGARAPGAKILVSGGGRCNVTNVSVAAGDFWTQAPLVRRVLRAFSSADAASFFGGLGVALHEEESGKLFPDSGRARTVLDALLAEARRVGASVRPGHRVLRAARDAEHFTLETSRGTVEAARVVLATGGLSLPKTGSDGGGYDLARSLGHSLVARSPALDPLLLDGSFHAELSGVSHDAEIAVHEAGRKPRRIAGALLWTHFGASGPAALDASRFWHRARLRGSEVELNLSFLPGRDFAAVESQLLSVARERPRLSVEGALAAWLPAAVAAAVATEARLDGGEPIGRLTRDARRGLVRGLLEHRLPVRGTRGYDFAEVTAGGVPLDEVEAGTLESRRCPGLHLVGEILDVDGRLGGFNFQWAWSSGWVAGNAIAAGLATTGRGR